MMTTKLIIASLTGVGAISALATGGYYLFKSKSTANDDAPPPEENARIVR